MEKMLAGKATSGPGPANPIRMLLVSLLCVPVPVPVPVPASFHARYDGYCHALWLARSRSQF
jgi:hypothetical protein